MEDELNAFVNRFLCTTNRVERYLLYMETNDEQEQLIRDRLRVEPIWKAHHSERQSRNGLFVECNIDLTDPEDQVGQMLLPWFVEEYFDHFIELLQILEITRVLSAPDVIDHSRIQRLVERRPAGTRPWISWRGDKPSFWTTWFYESYYPEPTLNMAPEVRARFFKEPVEFLRRMNSHNRKQIDDTACCFSTRFPILSNKNKMQPWSLGNSFAICYDSLELLDEKLHQNHIVPYLNNRWIPRPKFDKSQFPNYPRCIQLDIQGALLLFLRINKSRTTSCGLFLPREIQMFIVSRLFDAWMIWNRQLYDYRQHIFDGLDSVTYFEPNMIAKIVVDLGGLPSNPKIYKNPSRKHWTAWQQIKSIPYPFVPPTDEHFKKYARYILPRAGNENLKRELSRQFQLSEGRMVFCIAALLKSRYLSGEKMGRYVCGEIKIGYKEVEPFLNVKRLAQVRLE